MAAPLPGDVVLQVRRLEAAVSGLEEHLKPALDLQQHELDQVSPLQQAEFHLTVAQGLAAIYSLYAKTAGIPIKNFQKDLDRLQRYQKKVAKSAYEADLAAAKRTLTLDVATANRFINAAITDLPSGQREALRRAKRKRSAEESQPRQPSATELADAVIDDVFGSK